MTRILSLISGPLAAILIWNFVEIDPNNVLATRMAGITIWVAIWWLTEAVDLAVTSFLPLILIPAMGICDSKETAAQYMNPIIFLFIGGFILSFALEKWELHKRISLGILSAIGKSPSRILMAVMITTFFISMWMSNTATVLMLYPAVIAICIQMKQMTGKETPKIATALLLGLAYSASIGGMATLVGTPTNMILASYFTKNYPDNNTLTFGYWFIIGFPVALLLGIGAYWILKLFFISKQEDIPFDRAFFQKDYLKLGEMKREQWIVLSIFAITTVLWFSRADIDFGSFTVTGWSNYFPQPKWIQDGTVAMCMAMLLFFIPARKNMLPLFRSSELIQDIGSSPEAIEEDFDEFQVNNPSTTLLEWDDVKKLPFGIILLFGAGFALAQGIEKSHLSDWLALKLQVLESGNPILIVMAICAIICIISEFASNVSSIQLSLPILAILHQTLHVEPLLLMIPATLAASLGFMLPVATAPNTIVFGSKLIPVKDMMRAGLLIDLIGILIIPLVSALMK